MSVISDPVLKDEYNVDSAQKVDVGGFEMYLTPRYLAEYVTNPYEPYSSEIVRQLLTPNSTFLDVGAHYGYFGLLAHHVQPTTHIIAVEPVKENFDILQKNFALNQVPSCEVHNVAASDRTETRPFHIPEASNSASFYFHPRARTKEIIPVAAVALDELVAGRRVDFVKMDVEGHEIAVLQGLRRTLERNPELALLIEFNAKMQREAGHDPTELFRKLLTWGFEIFAIEEGAHTLARVTHKTFKWRELSQRFQSMNFLCLRGNLEPRLGQLGYPTLLRQGKLKVCFFSHSASLAGAEYSLLGRVEKLAENYDIESVVILPGEGVLRQKLEGLGAATEIVPYERWCSFKHSNRKNFEALLSTQLDSILEQAHQVIAKHQPDVLVSCTLTIPWGAFAAAIEDLPHIWSVSEFGVLDYGFEFFLPFQNVLRMIVQSSNRVLTSSEKIQEVLFPDCDPQQVRTIVSPIIIPEGVERRAPPTPDPFEILILGTIFETKGQLDAMLALNELVRRGRKVHLSIVGAVGEPDYFAKLQQTVQELGLHSHVSFHDFVEDRFEFILACHVSLSCSRMEAFGRTVAEASMLERPVIVTAGSGTVGSILPEQSGLSYPRGDYAQLADRIEFFIRNPQQIIHFGRAGREYMLSRVSEEATIGRLATLLNQVQPERNPLSTPLLRHLQVTVSNQRPEELTALQQQVASLSAQLASLQSQVRTKNAELVSRQLELAWLHDRIKMVEATKFWWLATAYWQTHARLVARLGRNEGLRVLHH
jgi:FkbM family methyltransferase